MTVTQIADQILALELPIKGLRFESNTHFERKTSFQLEKLASSEGPLISDFVTHDFGFTYGSYGIHIGQDDRLTFFGGIGKRIVGLFVDCRKGSPTEKMHVAIEYSASMRRRLIVPRGVAHTFDNLEAVVTRDEPVWHVDEANPEFNIDNDLISVSRSARIADFPSVRVNRRRLPDAGHILFSRFQQRLLQIPRSYSHRELVTIGNQQRYAMFNSLEWRDQFEEELGFLLNQLRSIDGVHFRKNAFALTGAKSYTIVPGTSHCVSDVLAFVPNEHFRGQFKVHSRTDTTLTSLAPARSSIEVDLLDLRQDSSSYGERETSGFMPDPRLALHIPAGVCYRIKGDEQLYVRCEQQFLVDVKEPRTDIPSFGQDLVWLPATPSLSPIRVPEIRVPDKVQWLLAKQEIQNFSNDPKTANQ